MILHHNSKVVARRLQCSGLSLIELIGILAIISLFAVVLFRSLIRETDADVSFKERATLRAYGEALKTAIKNNSSIPHWNLLNSTNWAAFVGDVVGASPLNVYVNSRNQPRVMLVDTDGWLGTITLPYVQTATGTGVLPSKARVILLTSVGERLPLDLGPGGLVDSVAFDSLWESVNGSFLTNSAWNGWNGRPQDILVERVFLSPLFVTISLTTQESSSALGLYAIGSDTNLYPAPLTGINDPTPPSPLLSAGNHDWAPLRRSR
jgi:type II secretory pathway pseudopilin PulG